MGAGLGVEALAALGDKNVKRFFSSFHLSPRLSSSGLPSSRTFSCAAISIVLRLRIIQHQKSLKQQIAKRSKQKFTLYRRKSKLRLRERFLLSPPSPPFSLSSFLCFYIVQSVRKKNKTFENLALPRKSRFSRKNQCSSQKSY